MNQNEKYIIVKLSDVKALASALREELKVTDGPCSAVLSDQRFADMFMRFEAEEGADIREIAELLKKQDICMACEVESQEPSCESLMARKLGRRLFRLIERADGIRAPGDHPEEKD